MSEQDMLQVQDQEQPDESKWWDRLPPDMRFKFYGALFVLAMLALLFTLAHLNTWGKPLLIILGVIVVFAAFRKYIVANECKNLDYMEKVHHHRHVEHYRTLATLALEAGHSVQLKHTNELG